MGNKRLSTAFHRTFALVRPAVAEVLEVIDNASPEESKNSLSDLLEANTSLGSIYREAMPRFAYGSGLLGGLSTQRKFLTEFGRQTRLHDPHLNDPATQWLMHYYLSAPSGPGPSFWNYLITRELRVGDELERSDVAQKVARVAEEDTGKPLATRTAQATATIFLGTYSKSDGLGPLGILRPIEAEKGVSYRVQEPALPPLWSVAYALADYWQATWGQQVTVNLTELTESGAFASIFLAGSEQLEQILGQLQQQRVLEVYRAAPPYQVVRLWADKNALLERLYE